MQTIKPMTVSLSILAALSGCAAPPMGPQVQVLPSSNKPFEAFQQDQAICKQFAHDQVSGQADSANEKAVGTAIVGGLLGAGLGAAVGGGHGAGVGAAGGGLLGTAIGASGSQREQISIQQQYDNAYTQCMYAKGNQIAAPPVRTVVQPMVIYQPPPVVYAQPQVIYSQPPVMYAPPPNVVYTTPPAVPPGAPPPPPAPPAP